MDRELSVYAQTETMGILSARLLGEMPTLLTCHPSLRDQDSIFSAGFRFDLDYYLIGCGTDNPCML